MKQLRIYFKNNECDQISWRFVANNGVVEEGQDVSDLLKRCAQKAKDIVFIVPQFWVYETEIDVSDKNAKQLLSAAAYQLEDQLAEDVDQLHFAQGREVNNKVAFVAISHEKMQCLQTFEKQNQMFATVIINEMALCPLVEENELCVFQHNEHFILKGHDSVLNTVCHASQKDFLINHAVEQNKDLTIKHFSDEEINLLNSDIEIQDCTNLKQKEYSQQYKWQKHAKVLFLPLGLTLLLIVIFIFNQWQNNQFKQQQILAIKQQQTDLLKKSLKDQSIKGSAKIHLIKALQAQQGSSESKGFLSSLHMFLMSKNKVSEINLIKVDYRNNKMTVDVTAKNLQQLDQLIELLKQQFTLTVNQMDSSNETSQGRFVLEQI